MNYYDIVSKEKKLVIKFDGGDLNIQYDSSFFTKDNSIIQADETQLYIDYIVKVLAKVITSWDLEIGGKVVPIKEGSLLDLSMSFLETIYNKISEDNANFFGK